MVAIAAAIGPLFGGIMTTFLSWRYGFAFELIIVVLILVMQRKIPDFMPTQSKSDLDITGSVISVIGLFFAGPRYSDIVRRYHHQHSCNDFGYDCLGNLCIV